MDGWMDGWMDGMLKNSMKDISAGGIAPNQVIARSEFEVHRQMFTE